MSTIEAKIKKSVDRYKKFLAGLNDKVTPYVQHLFNELSRQYDCEWKENNEIYFKEFDMYIKPPYSVSNFEGGSNEKAKERIKYIVTKFQGRSCV